MTNPRQYGQYLGIISKMAIATLTLTLLLTAMIISPRTAQAQTYTVLHNFSGGGDGADPAGGLTIDSGGNLYGVTELGALGYGTVYKLKHGTWLLTTLYKFTGGPDGAYPNGVVFGLNGTLYGNAHGGGLQRCYGDSGNPGCGVVFNLRPPAATCRSTSCPWTETLLYSFMPGGVDAANPTGDPIFDQSGVLYGTTEFGGGVNCNSGAGCGTVFQLVNSGGHWTETLLYSFTNDGINGYRTYAGVVFDLSGNLYGTNYYGPGTGCPNGSGDLGCGTVYELTPSGSGWTQTPLYVFPQDGSNGGHPVAGVIFDSSGNLYGATAEYGGGGGGTVFQLTPSGGTWNFNLLKSFSGGSLCGPQWNLTMDQAGNLYGTTYCDGPNAFGNVFKLTPFNGGWTYSDLYDFTGGSDGGHPNGGLVLDPNGNIYGTASTGGTNGVGVVWEITP